MRSFREAWSYWVKQEFVWQAFALAGFLMAVPQNAKFEAG